MLSDDKQAVSAEKKKLPLWVYSSLLAESEALNRQKRRFKAGYLVCGFYVFGVAAYITLKVFGY